MIASLKHRAHVLWVTFCLRCPNCERGKIFTGLFRMNAVCPYCGVRFERESGESVGGMYINLVLAELITIPGYFLTNALLPQVPQLSLAAFWVIFNVVFVTVFYRHARSMWIGTTYLTAGLHPDSDEDEDYVRGQNDSSTH